ncbi:cytochrome P450 6A1-like [Uranotaenia lowii]|uniref:cytochrome P450 6A1-like n=1 Tax=Uranotaenia lowii TaxID=190385 RepID=UPI002478EA78|nr:cytochrome P450 6A1-like [Uranotaenia lowii]
MDVVTLLLIVASLIAYAIFKVRKQLRFWKDLGIPHNEPNFSRNLRPTTHMAQRLQSYYHKYKGQFPMAGMYLFTKPVGLVIDLDLLKCIYVKDFQYFHDRGMYYNERDDPLSAHLFNLEGAKWRNLRTKISPTFTSGKMKMMYPTMIAAGMQFSDYMNEKVAVESEFELKDLLARFTTDVIGMCAFGIECNTMKDPNAQFRLMARKQFESPRNRFKDLVCSAFPKFARLLRLKSTDSDLSDFFLNVVRQTIDFRLKNDVQRNDFMDLMLGMMKTENPEQDVLTFKEVAAQAFVFFIAGFETSSTTLTWALYELSINQDIQEKARQTVKEVLEKNNNTLSYEAILQMNYLDQIINETLRKYPPLHVNFRKVVNDYQIPNTTTILPAGTSVMVPTYAIQHDTDVFPDPERFDPDRFTAENIQSRHPMAWTPFGEGPRICIGMRFGMMQTRIGLALLLKSFRFSQGAKSTVPLEFNRKSFILAPEGGLWLKVEKV